MLKTIWFFIIGDDRTHSVKVKPAESIDELKLHINTRGAFDLKNPGTLTLYRAELGPGVDEIRDKRIAELQRLSENLNACELLDEQKQISECFKNVQNKNYYVIVCPP